MIQSLSMRPIKSERVSLQTSHLCSPTGRTTDDAQTGLEAVVRALQPQLMVHLGVDVLQRRQSGTSRVTVVPAHQRQPAHEQVLTDLDQSQRDRR